MHYSQSVDTLVAKDLILSLNQCPKTHDKKERIRNVLYARAV